MNILLLEDSYMWMNECMKESMNERGKTHINKLTDKIKKEIIINSMN